MLDPFIARRRREPTGHGLLDSTSFGIKDMFDLAGEVTGFGSPDWLRTHGPAQRDCPVVTRLLGAGARLAGKTHLEELAFSLTGENAHYGTPLNPAAPARIPGGSSSGSASAVGSGLVDFALGTDTGGSVRIPSSFCGLFGIRTSHGALEMDGVLPLAPGFDTVGWMARDLELLRRVGQVLFGGRCEPRVGGLLIADDAWELSDGETRAALEPWIQAVAGGAGGLEHLELCVDGLGSWADAFRIEQGWEAWQQHGAWIERCKPLLGNAIRKRFEFAQAVTAGQAAAAREVCSQARARVTGLLGADRVLCIPTAPGPAPPLGGVAEETEAYRQRAMQLTCIAGLAGAPEISIPAGRCNGVPVGVSLIGAPGQDLQLLELARTLTQETG